MLNQPEKEDSLPAHLNSKSSLASRASPQKSDICSDTNDEAIDPCALCKTRCDSEKAKRPVNHRAKVTVQRRANTNQKVVSLSFDKAIELTSQHFLKKKASNNEGAERLEDERMLYKAGSGTDSGGNKPSTRTKVIKHTDNGVTGPMCTIPEVDSTWQHGKQSFQFQEDEVIFFETGDKVLSISPAKEKSQKTQDIAAPPIRLRQAWTSPTQVRQRRTSFTADSKATNTETKRDKRQRSQRNTTEIPVNSKVLEPQADGNIKPENPKNLEKQSDPDKETPVSQLTGDATTNNTQSKRKKTKRIDVKIPQVDDSVAAEESGSLSQGNSKHHGLTLERENTKTSLEPDNDADQAFAETKNHGMGDAEVATEKNDKHTGNKCKTSASTYAPDTDSFRDNKKLTPKKIKKSASSLFSWSPFRRKSASKNKHHESPQEDHAEKTTGKGYVAKTNMADVMLMQGRVAISQTLTEMFAASNPEKVAGVHQEKCGPK